MLPLTRTPVRRNHPSSALSNEPMSQCCEAPCPKQGVLQKELSTNGYDAPLGGVPKERFKSSGHIARFKPGPFGREGWEVGAWLEQRTTHRNSQLSNSQH